MCKDKDKFIEHDKSITMKDDNHQFIDNIDNILTIKNQHME